MIIRYQISISSLVSTGDTSASDRLEVRLASVVVGLGNSNLVVAKVVNNISRTQETVTEKVEAIRLAVRHDGEVVAISRAIKGNEKLRSGNSNLKTAEGVSDRARGGTIGVVHTSEPVVRAIKLSGNVLNDSLRQVGQGSTSIENTLDLLATNLDINSESVVGLDGNSLDRSGVLRGVNSTEKKGTARSVNVVKVERVGDGVNLTGVLQGNREVGVLTILAGLSGLLGDTEDTVSPLVLLSGDSKLEIDLGVTPGDLISVVVTRTSGTVDVLNLETVVDVLVGRRLRGVVGSGSTSVRAKHPKVRRTSVNGGKLLLARGTELEVDKVLNDLVVQLLRDDSVDSAVRRNGSSLVGLNLVTLDRKSDVARVGKDHGEESGGSEDVQHFRRRRFLGKVLRAEARS